MSGIPRGKFSSNYLKLMTKREDSLEFLIVAVSIVRFLEFLGSYAPSFCLDKIISVPDKNKIVRDKIFFVRTKIFDPG